MKRKALVFALAFVGSALVAAFVLNAINDTPVDEGFRGISFYGGLILAVAFFVRAQVRESRAEAAETEQDRPNTLSGARLLQTSAAVLVAGSLGAAYYAGWFEFDGNRCENIADAGATAAQLAEVDC